MFKHEKQLLHPVGIERPNPQYAALLQEQLGGGNGELKAAMQYMAQSFRIKDPEIKDQQLIQPQLLLLFFYILMSVSLASTWVCEFIILFPHCYKKC